HAARAVERARLQQAELRALLAAQRLEDAAELQRAHGRAGQERREEEVVAGRGQRGLVGLRIAQLADETVCGEAAAEDEDLPGSLGLGVHAISRIAASTSSTCPFTLTLGNTLRITPFPSMTKVVRTMPMNLRPYRLFSCQTPYASSAS